jgi:hypothetical protein
MTLLHGISKLLSRLGSSASGAGRAQFAGAVRLSRFGVSQKPADHYYSADDATGVERYGD